MHLAVNRAKLPLNTSFFNSKTEDQHTLKSPYFATKQVVKVELTMHPGVCSVLNSYSKCIDFKKTILTLEVAV